ncbi:MAG: hypothetical protein GXP03_06625 [Alphaproteobacteria bacterium]|nr:hypothetical protein [Alphaproteobacteria bacterium]
MKKPKMPPLPDTDFWRAYQGPFSGVLKWSDVDALWAWLADNNQGWFAFDPNTAAPDTPLDADDFATFLQGAVELVNTRRERSMSGAIYLDDANKPTLIKIFDPVNMGSACSISGVRVMPRWILSRMKPDDLPKPAPVLKPRFFGRLAGRL